MKIPLDGQRFSSFDKSTTADARFVGVVGTRFTTTSSSVDVVVVPLVLFGLLLDLLLPRALELELELLLVDVFFVLVAFFVCLDEVVEEEEEEEEEEEGFLFFPFFVSRISTMN